jgi:hypothetical protein
MGEADAEDGAGDGVALIRAVLTDTGAEPDPEEQGPTAVDGVIIADGSVSALDGIAVGGAEPHTAEDIAAFQLPPSGYDPYMFRIEPEPLRDRRPAELFHIEPCDPTGVRIGGFIIFPEAEISGLATNNVFKSPQRQGDAALDVRSSLRAVTDWYRHALEFRAAGGTSFFAVHPSEDDRAYVLEARGRLDITPRTNIEALVAHQRDKDIRSAPNVPSAAAERGDLEIDRAAIAFNHRFNRLSFQLRAAIRDFDFAPVPSLGARLARLGLDHLPVHRPVDLYRLNRRRLQRRTARQLGFEVRHAFRRRLIGSAGVRYTSTPYVGADLTERELVAELGLDYYVGRDTILFGRYQHIAFDSTLPASDSNADVLRLGVRVRY